MKYFLVSAFSLILLLSGGVAQAQDPPENVNHLANPSNISSIQDLLDTIIVFLNTILGPILVIVILIGAFKMLTAQGNETKFAEGKKTIQYAVIGAAIVIIADGIILIIKEILEVS